VRKVTGVAWTVVSRRQTVQIVSRFSVSMREIAQQVRRTTRELSHGFGRTRSNEESAQRMGDSMRALREQAEVLREDVARFQI
jgi:DNA-directed RNA polymerase sigma subunit (sigma70/sigma32)